MRRLAAYLLKLPNAELTEWEIKFLESISNDLLAEEFTVRQGEKLLQIRDDTELVTEVGYARLSVRILIEKSQLGYLDLDDGDDEWILKFPKGTATIRRRDASRLLRCARQLKEAEEEDAA
jgi:hypothetical protein